MPLARMRMAHACACAHGLRVWNDGKYSTDKGNLAREIQTKEVGWPIALVRLRG